ncbi:hypothetical protein [Streptomyces scabiei]|uniref:hypothetical protein n=1 Tax=Streptomyces scabiei TaxID=1930 RepID=UPI0038F7B206
MSDRLTVDTITSDQLDALQLKAARMQHAVAEYAKLRVQLEDTERERDEHKQSYLKACTTIAAMHAAAVGRGDLGPVRGVVEDVEDVRLRAEKAEAAVQRLTALRERWVKAGPPPLGTSINREWDKRLVELNAALDEPKES